MVNYIANPQVGFIEAMKLAFKKSLTFKGRARRSEYWWAQLGFVIIMLLLSWIPVVGKLAAIYISIASYALGFRRLHDTGRSGWWIGGSLIAGCILLGILIATAGLAFLQGDTSQVANMGMGVTALLIIGYIAIMVVGLVIFIFSLLDSHPEANKYGESPKYVAQDTEL